MVHLIFKFTLIGQMKGMNNRLLISVIESCLNRNLLLAIIVSHGGLKVFSRDIQGHLNVSLLSDQGEVRQTINIFMIKCFNGRGYRIGQMKGMNNRLLISVIESCLNRNIPLTIIVSHGGLNWFHVIFKVTLMCSCYGIKAKSIYYETNFYSTCLSS